MSLAGRISHAVGTGLAPLLPFWLELRARRGKEMPERLAERRGEAASRPAGPLLWLHAASVGESLSLLPLMDALVERRPDLHLLVTTGTVTAATLLMQRLPPLLADRVHHRFVPLDVPRWVETFLDGWRPDGAIFVESELWPNLTAALARRGIPLALVNARISARSARLWHWAPGLMRDMLGRFSLVVAQSEGDAERLRRLGAPGAVYWGQLKAAAEPLPADPAELARLRAMTGDRPIFLAASTHAGEEEIVCAAHAALLPRFPDLLTIIVPRHTERGAAIAALAAAAAAPRGVTRRAEGGDPVPEAGIHVADTLGELGLFYRLADVALVGATLVPKGGHNPLEPARLGCPILLGPHTENALEAAEALLDRGGALPVASAAALAQAVTDVLSDPARGHAMATAAAAVAARSAGLPGRLATAVLGIMPALPGDGAARQRGYCS